MRLHSVPNAPPMRPHIQKETSEFVSSWSMNVPQVSFTKKVRTCTNTLSVKLVANPQMKFPQIVGFKGALNIWLACDAQKHVFIH